MKLRTLATTALIGSAIALLAASPASAAPFGSVTPGQSTISPGGSTTITVNVSETVDVGPGTQVITTITPAAGATGTVTFAPLVSGVTPLDCVVAADSTEAPCLWTSGPAPRSGSVTFTVNASASAVGSFVISTNVTGSNVAGTALIGSVTLTVQAPPPPSTTAAPTTAAPTTAAPTTAAPTTAAPTTAVPATTAAPSSGAGTLPATGSNDVSWAIVVLAAMALTGGGVAVRLARRSES